MNLNYEIAQIVLLATAVLAAPPKEEPKKHDKRGVLLGDAGISTYGLGLSGYGTDIGSKLALTSGSGLLTTGNYGLANAYSSGLTYGLGGNGIAFDSTNIGHLGHLGLSGINVLPHKTERITGVTVHREVQVPVPVPQPVPVEVTKHVPVPHPVPFKVDRPYPVPVAQPVPVPVTRHVPVKVDRPYPVPVPQPVAVRVPQPVPVPVSHPVPVPVSLTKHVPVSVPAVPSVDIAHGGEYVDLASSFGTGLNTGIISDISGVESALGTASVLPAVVSHGAIDSGYAYAAPAYKKWWIKPATSIADIRPGASRV